VRLVSTSAFSTEAQIFIYTIYQTDNGKTKKKYIYHSRSCVVATMIRTFVSEFVCHPVELFAISYESRPGVGIKMTFNFRHVYSQKPARR
jgi:hypothetical protein